VATRSVAIAGNSDAAAIDPFVQGAEIRRQLLLTLEC
jgi:hypothetical protein